jgi:hypothetical protein
LLSLALCDFTAKADEQVLAEFVEILGVLAEFVQAFGGIGRSVS